MKLMNFSGAGILMVLVDVNSRACVETGAGQERGSQPGQAILGEIPRQELMGSRCVPGKAGVVDQPLCRRLNCTFISAELVVPVLRTQPRIGIYLDSLNCVCKWQSAM